MDPDHFFSKLADDTELADDTDTSGSDDQRAPAQLKSKVYSRLLAQLAATGPLMSLTDTKKAGRALCVFEAALAQVSVGPRVSSLNACRVCHARYLAEHLESAPIFWPHCPYAQFHRR